MKPKITETEFISLFENTCAVWKGDNALQGLNIIQKYFPGKTILLGADHDIIYSVSIEAIIEKGITIEDVTKLANLNWSIYEEYILSCFV